MLELARRWNAVKSSSDMRLKKPDVSRKARTSVEGLIRSTVG